MRTGLRRHARRCARARSGRLLRDAAAVAPDKVALDRRRPWSRRSAAAGPTPSSLEAAWAQAPRALLARFAPGERVALWAPPNVAEWVILEFGAGLAGLTLVAVNPVYRSARS